MPPERTALRPCLHLRAHLCCAVSVCAAAAFLAGCAAPSPATPKNESPQPTDKQIQVADQALAVAEAKLQEAFYSAGVRLRAACVSPENAPYFRKTACLASAITDDMKADTSRPTEAQKRAAKNIFRITHELNEETRGKMIASGIPKYIEAAQTSRAVADPKIRSLQEAFLSGRLTWGQYNQARAALVPENSSDETISDNKNIEADEGEH